MTIFHFEKLALLNTSFQRLVYRDFQPKKAFASKNIIRGANSKSLLASKSFRWKKYRSREQFKMIFHFKKLSSVKNSVPKEFLKSSLASKSLGRQKLQPRGQFFQPLHFKNLPLSKKDPWEHQISLFMVIKGLQRLLKPKKWFRVRIQSPVWRFIAVCYNQWPWIASISAMGLDKFDFSAHPHAQHRSTPPTERFSSFHFV